MDLGSNLVRAIDAVQVEEMKMYSEIDPTLLGRMLMLGREIFDFIHPHEWFFDKPVPSNFRLLGMLDNSSTLSVEVTPVQTEACIIQKNGTLTELLCHMTLHPEIWTDMVGWFSWARTTYEGDGLDKVYLAIPFSKKCHWPRNEEGISIRNVADPAPLDIILRPNTWLETNPRRSSIRIIDQNYEPVTGVWIHPPIQADGNKPLPWVASNMYSGIFTTLTPPGYTTMTFDPADNYPKAPPAFFTPRGTAPPSIYRGFGTHVDLSTIHTDSAIDNLDDLLEAAPPKKAPDPMKNFGKGKPDIVAEMFDSLDFNPPETPKKSTKHNDDPIPGLEDFF